MAINKKLIHFNNFSIFNSQKLSANKENTKYTLGINGDVKDVTVDDPLDILYQSICYIKDTQQQWTHGQLYDCSSLISGENIKTINNQSILGEGNIAIKEPYLAPFSVAWLDGAIEGYYSRFPKDEFITAVVDGRPLVVPIHDGDTSGITASYYTTPATAETGKGIVIDIIHDSKIYHLVFEDIPEQPFFIVGPDNVSCKDLANTFVLPYTLDEIIIAANKRTKLQVDVDFVDAVNSNKLILITTGKTNADGRYIVAHCAISDSSDSVWIRLKIQDPSYSANETCYFIDFSSKSVAPTEADVSVNTTTLITANNLINHLRTIYSGDSITVTRPNAEFTVNSIDGATFINDGETTAMTPNTVYNFVNNGVNRTIAVYDDHRVVITSENNSTVALSPAVTYTSQARIMPSALPSSLVTQLELRESIQVNQSDWAVEEGDAGFVKNRTHYHRVHNKLRPSQEFVLATPVVINGQQIQSLSDYKLLLNDKFYEFDESVSAGDTITFGVGEKQQAVFTVLSKSTLGNITRYEYRLKGAIGVTADPNGFILNIFTKGKTLDPSYLPDEIVYEDELPQSDWNEADNTKPTYVVNRTHFAGNKGYFPIGQRFSLPDTTGTHSPDSYRFRYKGELYKLPNVGETVYYPNEAEAIFSVTLAESSSGSTTTYTMQSAAINLAEGEESLVEVVSAKNSKKLDDFYIPDTIARKGDLVTTLVYKATSKVENAGWTEDTFGAPIIRHEYNEETKVGVIYLGDRITKMGNSAFDGCSSLTSITIPDSVTSIGSSAFKNCDAMTSINIPESVTSIGTEAFYGCTGELVVNCNIPSALYYAYAPFYGSKFTYVTIGDNVTTIGDYAFNDSSSLTNVTISDSVTSIGKFAFEDCSSLTSIAIPDSVTTIGVGAFQHCSGLSSVTIGDSVTTIEVGAFWDCSRLTNVYCKATTPPAGGSSMFTFYVPDLKIYVPMESVEAYKSAEWWSEYASDIVGEGDILALEALTSDEISEIYLNNFNINIYFGSGVSGDGISAALTDESENIEEPIDESSSE